MADRVRGDDTDMNWTKIGGNINHAVKRLESLIHVASRAKNDLSLYQQSEVKRVLKHGIKLMKSAIEHQKKQSGLFGDFWWRLTEWWKTGAITFWDTFSKSIETIVDEFYNALPAKKVAEISKDLGEELKEGLVDVSETLGKIQKVNSSINKLYKVYNDTTKQANDKGGN